MKIYKDRLLQTSSILFILNMLASALNYVCQLIFARALSVESFGTVNTIFSFLLIVGVPGTTLTMVVAKYYAEAGQTEDKVAYIAKIIQYVFIWAILFLILCLVMIDPLASILATSNKVILIYAFVLGATSFFQPLFSGVFSGNRRFILVGIYSLTIPIYKIVSVIIAQMVSSDDLVKLYTILFIMVLGTVVTFLFGYWKTVETVGKVTFSYKKNYKLIIKSDDLNTLILNVCLMLYMNIDLLAVRYYGKGEESGLYSSVLLFGRIVYYFATTLGTILLPMAATAKTEKKEHIKLLNRSMLLMFAFAFVCIVPINIGGEYFIQLLYGESYLGAQVYIKYVSIIAIALSVCTLLINYLVGVGRTKFATISMVLINVLILVLIIVVKQIAIVLTCIGVVGLVGSLVIYAITILECSRRR